MTRLATGVPELDGLLQGGLPLGSSVVLQGPPGPEKFRVSLAFLAEGLRAGGSGLVVTASQAAGTVLQSLRLLGVDVERAANEKRLRIIDWYSWSKKAVPEIEEHGIILTAPLDLAELGTALSRGIGALQGSEPKRAVVELLSPATEVYDLHQVAAFAEASKLKFDRHKITALVVVEKEWHDAEALAKLQGPFDGILEIDRSAEGGRVARRIGVLRLEGVSRPAFVPLASGETGPAPAAATPPARARPQAVPPPPPPPPPPEDVPPVVPASRPRAIPPPPPEEGPKDRDFVRGRVQEIALTAKERLRKQPRDSDAMFALAAAESILGHPIVAVGLLDRLEILNAGYPGLWDLKAKLYADLGDRVRAAQAHEKADAVYAKARTPEAPTVAAGAERDLIRALDDLARSVAEADFAETEAAAPAGLAAGEMAASEVELEAPPPGRRAVGRSKTPRGTAEAEPEAAGEPGFMDRLTSPFGSSRAAKIAIPAVIVAVLLIVPLVFFSGLLAGPAPATGGATPMIAGLNLNPLYGDVMGGTEMSFRVTVTQNSFSGSRMIRPVISGTNLTAGTDVVMIASVNNVSYAFANPAVTQNGAVFTYDFGPSFEQSVGAGATGASAPTWYFQFHYAVSTLPSSPIAWSAQFVSG